MTEEEKDKINSEIYDMLEKHIDSQLTDYEKNILILKLCQSINILREDLDWYGKENHIVSTWYDRENKNLCQQVENDTAHWKNMNTEDREYVELGHRAEIASCRAELPENIIEKLTNKES